jgi:hypothetical protein
MERGVGRGRRGRRGRGKGGGDEQGRLNCLHSGIEADNVKKKSG